MQNLFDQGNSLSTSENLSVHYNKQLLKKKSKFSCSSEAEESIMSWFEKKGIIQGNPEDIKHLSQSPLKCLMKEKIRKLSVPS